MIQSFVPAVPQTSSADIVVDAPPDLPPPASLGMLPRLLPVALSLVCMGVLTTVFTAGTGVARNPTLLAFPAMMLVSTVVTGLAGRSRRHGGGIDADRDRYLDYLSGLSRSVCEIAVAQQHSSISRHPDPDTLWTLIGSPRMWERRPTDPDFGLVRVGMGTQPLARRLVAPQLPSEDFGDPVTAAALRRFLRTHSTIQAPVTVGLREGARVTVGGDPGEVRALLRAILCQLAVLHAPDQLQIAAVIDDEHRGHWDWLKWLPHNQHPEAADEAGPVRMVYSSTAAARRALATIRAPEVVVVTDVSECVDTVVGATTIAVGGGRDGAPLEIRPPVQTPPGWRPDQLTPVGALICARRLAGHHACGARPDGFDPWWPRLAGLHQLDRFDPVALWGRQRQRDRLRVPIGTAVQGTPLELDIKEPAEGGMGPHGLCIGATGSGKSELLRCIALGMMARNSPETLNLLLVDFKGGATFRDYAGAPHVAAVITNLADDAPLVARMRDALAGEMNRRQQLLRTAGCVSVAAYERARRGGPAPALPTLFVIVDEFSELLSQHPDFADTFVAIGRLGRSLGIHLLLASQRLEEGRLRGLESHLSYRVCLKTLSASDSQGVLGNLDAYRLPNAPGAGFLRVSGGEPVRFQTALVSAPLRKDVPARAPAGTAPPVRVFSTRVTGAVSRTVESDEAPERTVSGAVLDRLSGLGPPAHPVWLPPLGAAPALHIVLADVECRPGGLTIPIGIVDRPFDQRRTPLMLDLSAAAGNVAVVGAPQSGKSTTLRTLITALAATHDPGQAQFYCLDFGGGALSAVQAMPHVGAVAGRAEPRLAGRIVAECESVVRRRAAVFREHGIASIAEYRRRRADMHACGDPFGDVFLVIDGWASLRQAFESLEEPVITLAAQGLSYGVHVVLSASRWPEVRPALRDQIGTRIELRLGDPADSEIDRRAAQHVPRDRPGRGLSPEGLHMVIALPVADVPAGESVAPPIPLLPTHVDREDVVHGSSAELGARILLGLAEREMRPMALDFAHHTHFLVLGDNGCGKTTTLRTLCREIVRTKTPAQAKLLIVDFRRALLGVVESAHLGGYAISPAALAVSLPDLLEALQARMPPPDATQAQLRRGSWWSGPDLYVVVDDYDLVAGPAGNPLAPIVELLPYAADLGLHLVIARHSGGVERAMFEPLLASLRDRGCASLMMSGCPAQGAVLGSSAPVRLPPGRGVLTTRAGDEELVQVGWTPP